MHTYLYANMCAYTHACLATCIHLYTYININIHTHSFIHVCLHTSISTCIKDICMSTFIHGDS